MDVMVDAERFGSAAGRAADRDLPSAVPRRVQGLVMSQAPSSAPRRLQAASPQ